MDQIKGRHRRERGTVGGLGRIEAYEKIGSYLDAERTIASDPTADSRANCVARPQAGTKIIAWAGFPRAEKLRLLKK